MSLTGLTTEIKIVKWDRKYRCDTKGKNIYVKFVKTQYNKARRRAAREEIEEALSDFDYEEGDLLEVAYEDLYSCYYDAFPDLDDDWDEDPWDYYEDYEEDRNDFYDEYEDRENLEMALRGDWQEEVPEVFGDEFEAIVAA